ncbi:thiosulfate sulfurtransferase PspE precursor [bacterium BMS3Abin04]|nr:thiosulfate sulfurtransferase PspE precursor [bacterium BMS3Abin04]
MYKSKIILMLLIISATALVSCAQQKTAEQKQIKEKASMTVAELREEMKTDSNLVILDVRTPAELTGPLGHIEGVVNIPVQVLEQRIHELDKYKDKNIAVICRSGNRSGIATPILIEHGFKATNVLGGMIAYNKLKK